MSDFATLGIKVDEDGFMEDPDCWTEDVARAIAATEDVPELTEDHWKIINYLRQYFKNYGMAPMIRRWSRRRATTCRRFTHCSPAARPRAPARSPACPSPPAACKPKPVRRGEQGKTWV